MRILRIFTTLVFAATLGIWSVLTFVVARGEDRVPPVITADTTELSLSVKDGPQALLQGLRAYDDRDGDLTDQILVGKQTRFVQKGTTEVTFLVFDSSNNLGTCTRTVTYTDYRSPRFTLQKPLVYGTEDTVQVLDRLSAEDEIQGNIDDKLKIVSSSVNNTKPGLYEMGVEVSNRFGDLAEITLPILIVPTTRNVPQITLSQYLLYLQVGDTFDPARYLRTVTLADGSPQSRDAVILESNVDTQVPGTYAAVYSCPGEDGRTGYTSLTVVVAEEED